MTNEWCPYAAAALWVSPGKRAGMRHVSGKASHKDCVLATSSSVTWRPSAEAYPLTGLFVPTPCRTGWRGTLAYSHEGRPSIPQEQLLGAAAPDSCGRSQPPDHLPIVVSLSMIHLSRGNRPLAR